MSTIFITEKPSVAQKYRKVLKIQSNGKTDGYVEGFSTVMNTNVIITWAYEAIEKRFMNTMKPPFVYDAVSVTYLHKNGERFFESFRIVREKGFKEKIDGDDIVTKPIPEKGSTVAVDSFSVYDMETKPPSVYTTGSLILAMEKAGKLIEDEELREQIKTNGIGTSATRAGIIEKLSAPDKNGISFITIDSKTQKVAPTEFGKKIVIPSDRERQIFEIKTTNYYSENRTVRKSVCPSRIPKRERIQSLSVITHTIILSAVSRMQSVPQLSTIQERVDLFENLDKRNKR